MLELPGRFFGGFGDVLGSFYGVSKVLSCFFVYKTFFGFSRVF